MATISDFVYTPLVDPDSCIRLLEIAPPCDNLDGKLCGTLQAFRRDDVPPYQPVSYTWGTQEPSAELLLRESAEEEWHRFAIRPNLEQLLLQFRGLLRCKYIWVDAICINQKDNEEKAFQVRNMDKVYRGRKVNIWLGQPSKNSDLAMDMFNQFKANISLPPYSDSSRNLNQEVRNFLDSHPVSSATWQAIYDLVRRPWFSRRWIVQEFVLSSHQHFWIGSRGQCFVYLFLPAHLLGNESWYNDFSRSKQVLCSQTPNHFHSLPSPDLDSIQALERLWMAYIACCDGVMSELTLERLLDSFSGFFSYDPRDAIYAFLSMASDVNVSDWMPDYSDENRTTDLYARAACHIMARSGRTDIICRSAQNPAFASAVSHLTSWVPWFGPQEVKYGTSGYSQDDRQSPQVNTYSLHGYNMSSLITFGRPDKRLKPGDQGWSEHVHCGGCGRYVPHNGIKCQNCDDFDYCNACAKQSDVTHDPTHVFRLHNGAVYFASGSQICDFGGDWNHRPHIGLANLTFSIPGFMVDSIRAVGGLGMFRPIHRSNHSLHSCFAIEVGGWLSLPGMENHLDEYGSPDESFYRTITGNRIYRDGHIRHAPQSWIRKVRSLGLGRFPASREDIPESSDQDYERQFTIAIFENDFEIRKSVESMCSSQRKFVTTFKSLGIVPSDTREGDSIAIIIGCSVPVVIRNVREAGNGVNALWKLVGECYIDGIMEGEFMESLGKGCQEETITLL